MRRLRAWAVRWVGHVRTGEHDRGLDAEIQAHLQFNIEDNLRQGMTSEEAHRHARLSLGGVALTSDRVRDGRRLPTLDLIRLDLTYAWRGLRRSPTFAAVAIAMIALGIAATTAIFTVVNAVLLRPLRFADPQRLTMISPSSGARLSSAYLHDWRAESRTIEDMAGWQDVRVNLTGRGAPLELLADRVTSNFF